MLITIETLVASEPLIFPIIIPKSVIEMSRATDKRVSMAAHNKTTLRARSGRKKKAR